MARRSRRVRRAAGGARRRILVVSHEARRTGAPVVALEVVRSLWTPDDEVVCALRGGGPLEPEFATAADRIVREPLPRVRALLRRARPLRPLVDRWDGRIARRLLARERPAVVVLNTVKSACYVRPALRLGLPTVLYVHELEPLASSTLARYRLEEAWPEVHLAACSSAARANLARLAAVPVDDVALLVSPVDVAAVRRRAGVAPLDDPTPAEDAPGNDAPAEDPPADAPTETAPAPARRAEDASAGDAPLVVGACGTVEERKGTDLWLAAARAVRDRRPDLDVRFRWVGRATSDWARALAADAAADADDRVELVGEVAEPHPQIAAMDVFVMASREDPFPLVVLEAMALGRPVVAFDVGGLREQLADTGVLVEPGDPDALAGAVLDLLDDAPRRRRLGDAAAARVRRLYDVERFAPEVRRVVATASVGEGLDGDGAGGDDAGDDEPGIDEPGTDEPGTDEAAAAAGVGHEPGADDPGASVAITGDAVTARHGASAAVTRAGPELDPDADAGGPRRVVLLKYWQVGDATRLHYRAELLERSGIELDVSDAVHHRPWTWRPVHAVVRRAERLGVPFLQTLLATGRISRADGVVAMFESQGNALAFLRSLGIWPFTAPRYVVVACWLADDAPRFGRGRLAWYRWAYRGVDRVVFFSRNQIPVYRDLLGIPEHRLRFVPFGVDDEYFTPPAGAHGPDARGAGDSGDDDSGDDDGYVLAVGRDRGRDWPTLFEAVRGTGLDVRVACRPEDIAGLDVPPEVTVVGFVDRATYRDLTGGARVVVVATHERAYPTGQSVTLESMAMGRCCIVTDTPAMRDYLTDGEDALLVPLHDPEALRASIRLAHVDGALRRRVGTAARAAVEERFNARAMWASVADVLTDGRA